ncbi:MAG: hypothetical protein MUF50_01405 [Planctomycetes bacterium]|jgi:hypothetical protein|nr:hypothetical protein [Planctomycetota bacterium]
MKIKKEDILKNFIYSKKGDTEYDFHIGKTVASALSGFIAGVITTLIIWMVTNHYIFKMIERLY